ncbi:signal peptidase I [Corallococcus terminator]
MATLLTLVASPGVGHVLVGRWPRGALWVGAMMVLNSSLPFVGFAGVVTVLALLMAAVVDVVRVAPPVSGVPPRWRALLLVAGVWFLSSVAVAGIRASVAKSWRIPSGGMDPSLLQGDVIMVDASVASPLRRRLPRRGEVLVFDPPHAPESPFLQRLIASGGDTVRMEGGRLWLNGQLIPRRPTEDACVATGATQLSPGCVVYEETLGELSYRTQGGGEGVSVPREGGLCPALLEPEGTSCKVPQGHLFLVGDNRGNSFDSRYFGAVPEASVHGVAAYIFFAWAPGRGVGWDRLGQWLQ